MDQSWDEHNTLKKNMSKTSFDVNITYSSYPGVEDSKYLNSLTHFFRMSLWILKIFFSIFLCIYNLKKSKRKTGHHHIKQQNNYNFTVYFKQAEIQQFNMKCGNNSI